MTVTHELIDSLLADYKKPEDRICENGLLKLLTRKLVGRARQAEMAEHMVYLSRTFSADGLLDREPCYKGGSVNAL